MITANTATDTSLQVSRVIQAEPEAVFRAWTDPAELEQWFGPEGMTLSLAEVDLSVGGQYRIRIENAENKARTVTGVYREIEPHTRLAFTWDWEEEEFHMGEETLVTVDLADLGGSTEVRITHERFPNAEAVKGHEEGWTSSLNCLERLFD